VINFKNILSDLKKEAITADILLSRCLFAEQTDKTSFICNDNQYVPLYYHLGKYITPKTVLVMGIDTGLLPSCFLKSNLGVSKILGFQEENEDFYSSKIASYNILVNYYVDLNVYCGNALDEVFQNVLESYDLIIFNLDLNYDKLRNYMDIVWDRLNLNGTMAIESGLGKHTRQATNDFLKTAQKEYFEFNNRYDTILVVK
jgi:hypothetical protein